MHLATISSQRQITIPKYILDKLDLELNDKLLLHVQGSDIIMKPRKTSIIDELAGSMHVPSEKRGKSFKEIMRITKKIMCEKLAKEGLE